MLTARENKRIRQHPQQRVCDAKIPPVLCNGVSVVEQGQHVVSQREFPGEDSGNGNDPRTALRREENLDMEIPEGPGGGNGQESQEGADTPK